MFEYCRIPLAALAAIIAFASPATAQSAGLPPFARAPDKVVMPSHPENLRLFTDWGFAEAVIDGDRIYLSGVVAGLRPGVVAGLRPGESDSGGRVRPRFSDDWGCACPLWIELGRGGRNDYISYRYQGAAG